MIIVPIIAITVVCGMTLIFSASLVRTLKTIEKARREIQFIWQGIIRRGFLEAERTGNLKRLEDGWELPDKTKNAYSRIANGLREVYRKKEMEIGRSPTDDELAWAIERKYQDWMLLNVCQTLGVNQHGCTAIASIIAREPEAVGDAETLDVAIDESSR